MKKPRTIRDAELDDLWERSISRLLGTDQKAASPAARPEVKTHCTCPNQGKPEESGDMAACVRINPSCVVHGLKTPTVTTGQLGERSARTVGVGIRKRDRYI